jgi:hypothetical protein
MTTAYAEMMFAHQGGWDEALYALVPIAVIFGLLWLANSRAKKLQNQNVTDRGESD